MFKIIYNVLFLTIPFFTGEIHFPFEICPNQAFIVYNDYQSGKLVPLVPSPHSTLIEVAKRRPFMRGATKINFSEGDNSIFGHFRVLSK